jgi:membrane protein DedA with SNARE-associated domain
VGAPQFVLKSYKQIMPDFLQSTWDTILGFTHAYGYHAVVPTLLLDPAGVPWAWIFLMLIAGEAKLNIAWMLGYGVAVMTVMDHALYALGYYGGRPLLNRLAQRWPKVAAAMTASEKTMRGKGVWMVAWGRYLPVVGRWVGTGAALANVPYLRFAIFDALGVAVTVLGFGAVAHFIGREIIQYPWFPQAILGAYLFTTVVTALATAYGMWRVKQRKAQNQI